MKYILLLLFASTISIQNKCVAQVAAKASKSPNILLIIADDLGKDAIAGYTEGKIKPKTPHIDAIRNSGLAFTNLWVNPVCSPTRASIITGKYGYRTGVKDVGDTLKPSEIILQRFIKEQTKNKYATAVVGKWHLAGNNASFNPETLGIDYYAGFLNGTVQNYYNWPLTQNGSTSNSNEYTTQKFTDLAISWIQKQEKPWFLWLAYNAPHTPFHVPPNGLDSHGNLTADGIRRNPLPYYMAAIEAMDFQIGRLLEQIPVDERKNTIIIFIGDNGTPRQVAQSPYSNAHSKGSLYQGGINTPMFIAGPRVTRIGVDDNLINSTDLFATIAELTGVPVKEIHDSKSFTSLLTGTTPIRRYQYADKRNGMADSWTISNGKYKLIVATDGVQKMYDLQSDPYENTDLLTSNLTAETSLAKQELEAELNIIRK